MPVSTPSLSRRAAAGSSDGWQCRGDAVLALAGLRSDPAGRRSSKAGRVFVHKSMQLPVSRPGHDNRWRRRVGRPGKIHHAGVASVDRFVGLAPFSYHRWMAALRSARMSLMTWRRRAKVTSWTSAAARPTSARVLAGTVIHLVHHRRSSVSKGVAEEDSTLPVTRHIQSRRIRQCSATAATTTPPATTHRHCGQPAVSVAAPPGGITW